MRRLTLFSVIAADGLYKRLFCKILPRFERTILIQVLPALPDPFAVATVNGEQTRTTGVVKKTLDPYWNESFDLCVYKLMPCSCIFDRS